MSKPACVVTTIHPPSAAIRKLCEVFPGDRIIIGDRKTPKNWFQSGALFLSLHDQEGYPFDYVRKAPENHYSRKNIGYLRAFMEKASVVYDTDDDNIPNSNWKLRELDCSVRRAASGGWCNVYQFFHTSNIWPRGFALGCLQDGSRNLKDAELVHAPVQQGVSDKAPDVDAIWRLTTPQQIKFSENLSVYLSHDTWCPFNSQITWWWPEAYPLMYLPAFVNFRMTDIWRSFVAQRCLWAMGWGVVHHSPAEVVQERNVHNLMHDFKDEIPGYLHNQEIAQVLDSLSLGHNTLKNLLLCYQALVRAQFIPGDELIPLEAWVNDLRKMGY